MNPTESIYGKLNTEPRWYALKTRSRHEKKVDELLQQKGITSFLPLYSTLRQWSDRKKKVTLPLFSCYLFVKIPLKDRLHVLRTDGAVHLVSFNNIPASIPEIQIDSIRKILGEKVSIQKVSYFAVDQKVEVTYGPFKGVQGIVKKVKGKSRLIITIDVLCQAISVEIDDDMLRPISYA